MQAPQNLQTGLECRARMTYVLSPFSKETMPMPSTKLNTFPAHPSLLVGITLLIWLCCCDSTRADLHFVRPQIDAGEIRGGMPVPQRFPFINNGNEVIEIIGLHVSCGCLKPKVETRI